MLIEGGCLCGAVRFRSTAGPIITRTCWCRLCQYLGAGSATVSACFPREEVTIEGLTADYPSVSDGGNTMHRRFCPTCGTPLFSEAESRPHLIFIRVGALDDPSFTTPAASIWTAQAPVWACIDPAIPNIEGQPPPPRTA
jgi:hypothetical protein